MSKRRALSLLLALVLVMSLGLMAVPAAALNPGEAWVGDFVVKDGTTLVKYYGEDSTVTIPSGITTIGANAFQDCTSLTRITIPNGVTTIDQRAFLNCTNLASVTIPNSVTTIREWAFADCTNLTSVTIPNSVTKISLGTFQDCTGLTSVTIPDSVTTIASYAFQGCASLTSINIPNSVTAIGSGAFWGCTSLTSVAIPNSVTKISDWAFSACTSLTSVTIPNSVTTIGEYAFSECTSLTDITIPDGVTEIDSSLFQSCTGLTSVTIPFSVTEIRSNAFFDCNGLTDVYYAGSAAQWKAVYISNVFYGDNVPLLNATIHYNSPMPEAPKPTVPTIVSTGLDPEATGTAHPSTQNVLVDGKPVEFQYYKLTDTNGGETNYVKLRDLADILDGTAAQFNVTWSEEAGVGLQTKTAYLSRNGSEGKTTYSGNQPYERGSATTAVNGEAVPLQCFTLIDGAYTYYKLRDLGQALGFNVGWDEARGVFIETDKPYDPNN